MHPFPSRLLTYLDAAWKGSHGESPKSRKQQDNLPANNPHLLCSSPWCALSSLSLTLLLKAPQSGIEDDGAKI